MPILAAGKRPKKRNEASGVAFNDRRHMMTMRAKQYGFSLIELLVVLLIIGLGISYAALNVGNDTQTVKLEAKQLANRIALVAVEAAIGRQQWGVDIFRTDNEEGLEGQIRYGYRWLIKVRTEEPTNSQLSSANNDWQWRLVAPPELDDYYLLPEGIGLQLIIEGLEVVIDDRESLVNPSKPESLKPDIYLFATGEMTDFKLQLLNAETGEVRHRIHGDQLGRVSLDKVDDDE